MLGFTDEKETAKLWQCLKDISEKAKTEALYSDFERNVLTKCGKVTGNFTKCQAGIILTIHSRIKCEEVEPDNDKPDDSRKASFYK